MQEVAINLKKELAMYNRDFIFQIVQVGCGGNGGYLVQHLAQMLSMMNVKARYILADPDIVEEKNLRNQLFVRKDVGLTKAEVLAKRYQAAYNIQISYYDKSYIETKETLSSLLNATEYNQNVSPNEYYSPLTTLPILIGCVDNNYSRQLFHEYFEEARNLLYIDVGIDAANIPQGKSLENKNEWTKEEILRFNRTGYTGQVVLGLKFRGQTVLEPVAGVYPDILEDTDNIAPSQTACSSLVVSEPQRLITNRFAAMAVSMYFNDIFSTGTIRNHYTVFHSLKGYMRSQPILMEIDE